MNIGTLYTPVGRIIYMKISHYDIKKYIITQYYFVNIFSKRAYLKTLSSGA